MRFNIDIDALLKSPMNALIYWKDVDLNYLGCNELLEETILKSKNNIIGKNDYDISCKKDEAKSFRDRDRQVIQTGMAVQSHDILTISPKKLEITELTFKMPLTNQGKIAGVLGISHIIKKRILTTEDHENLSKRETECLHFWMQGKSAKQIAAILGLSQRTVENYINNIKIKWNCYSKSQVITKALEKGFLPVL